MRQGDAVIYHVTAGAPVASRATTLMLPLPMRSASYSLGLCRVTRVLNSELELSNFYYSSTRIEYLIQNK